jgi:hypothetical protein
MTFFSLRDARDGQAMQIWSSDPTRSDQKPQAGHDPSNRRSGGLLKSRDVQK